MKIQFDANQRYQLDAVGAVVDLFDGQPLSAGQFEMASQFMGTADLITGTRNTLRLNDDSLLANLRAVQDRNGVEQAEYLVTDSAHVAPDGSLIKNFSIEMETGTGKTYVYLRTIYELSRLYGFKKFIIVVPSVAIREGVQKSIELTREHFRELFQNEPMDCWAYDSTHVNKLRSLPAINCRC